MVSNQIGPLMYQPTGHCSRPLVMHINDSTADIESKIWLFAGDCVCYREIKVKEPTLKHTEGY